ncbi:signal transduction histidine kinase [Streptomyces sp. 3330]|uniref:sensor histidine kinase n=1 Tax=Streptomyces sp. 3330 TaxID=2817755 RepID=UPI00285B3A1D|nr:histidine kinase [Streptomyces sp. 3330]MDR6974988.1 signal transduction histidine kinase [Streptomyces sp. 3330]
MSAYRPAAAAETARADTSGAAPPSPGFEAVWAHPLLGRLLRDRSRRQRLDRRHPWLLDTAVVLIVVAVTLPELLRGDGNSPFGDADARDRLSAAALSALVAALVVPLWWRRRAPAVTYFVITAVSLVQWSLGIWLPTGVGALVALYTLARNGSLRMLGRAVALTVVELLLAVFVLVPVDHPVLGGFFLLGTMTSAVAVGLTLRIRGMYLEALEDRARRLEIEQEQRLRLTAAAERSRVAREMHDIVGHNLSVMVSVADGAAVLAANRGERSADALRILGDTGRQAMSELRRVLGVLREDRGDERPLGPQPGVRDLDPLLDRVRAAGLAVTYRTVGDLDPLGEGVQLTVYRVVQEALTNTLKHAGTGSVADVTVIAESGAVRIRVADTGTPPGAPARPPSRAAADGPGHGLVGIRQRAAMYGGTVIAGPRETGHGWTVDVVLDVPCAPTPPAPGERPS